MTEPKRFKMTRNDHCIYGVLDRELNKVAWWGQSSSYGPVTCRVARELNNGSRDPRDFWWDDYE